MMIEVESLKELEPGKTYALQLQTKKSHKDEIAIARSAQEVGRQFGFNLILLPSDTKLIDAPKEIEMRNAAD